MAIACASSNSVVHSDTKMYHTKKVVDAAEEIVRLITIPCPLLVHTPFFTCAVAMQATAHLGVYWLPLWKSKQSLIVRRVQLSVGALKKLGVVWPTARKISQQVKEIARIVITLPKQNNVCDYAKDQIRATETIEQPDSNIFETIPENTLSFNDKIWLEDFLTPDAIE